MVPAADAAMTGGRASRRWYLVSAGLLGVYALDVLVGKLGQKAGFTAPLQLGDVGEFMVVLAGMASFVAGLLLAVPDEKV